MTLQVTIRVAGPSSAPAAGSKTTLGSVYDGKNQLKSLKGICTSDARSCCYQRFWDSFQSEGEYRVTSPRHALGRFRKHKTGGLRPRIARTPISRVFRIPRNFEDFVSGAAFISVGEQSPPLAPLMSWLGWACARAGGKARPGWAATGCWLSASRHATSNRMATPEPGGTNKGRR